MTQFVTTDLPSSVNTVEKLFAWSATVLNHLYPQVTAIEDTGQAERVAQSAPFEVTTTDPTQWRLVSRFSLPIDRNWQRGNDGLWASIQDIGSLSIPTEFKS